MATKKTFIWYLDWIDYATSMTNEELWLLFREILLHLNWEEEIELPPEFKFTWAKIKKNLDEDKEKRDNKIEERRKKRSEAWKKHTWNQYTKGDKKRNSKEKAQKMAVEQMEQMEQNGTVSWYTYNNIISSYKEEKNIRKEEMLEAFRNDNRLTRYENEEDVIRWWDHKQANKKPYKDVSSFMRAMVKIKNTIKYYWDTLKSDRDIKNRFNYAVTEAIEKGWEWLNWYDSMEQVYENSKDDLYPNPKQNE